MKNINILYTILFAFVIQIGNGQSKNNTPQLLPIKGQNAQFTEDGQYVIYNANGSEIRKFNMEDLKDEKLINSGSLFVIDGANIKIKDRNENHRINIQSAQAIKLDGPNNGISVWPTSDLRSISVSVKGAIKYIQPKGEQDYINVSLSPDKTKIIFRATGQGSFISDLDGNIIKEIKDAEFPSWVNNKLIIYSLIKDDGYNYESSELYIMDINNGTKTWITEHINLIPLYPMTNKDGDKVIFSTPENDVYLMKL